MLEKPSVKVIVLGLLVTIVASVPGLCQDNSTTVGPTMPMPDGNSTATVDCGSGVICYNGGRCNSTFNCICATGYQGYDCSRQSCEDRCLNGGTCDGLGNCLCVFGFAGEYCRSTLEVCGTTPNRTICYNNGSCVNGSCVCTDGFGGTSCSDYICDNPCLNGGSCYLNDCSCPDGFSGRTCEQTPGPECGDSYCYNNGSCGANDTCTCIGSYLPPYCRLRGCDQPCQNNASCYDGSCSCPSGYSGMYCETTLTVCGNFSEIFCYNNGTCQNNTCVCVGSYTGSDCSTVVAGNSTTSSPNSTVAPSNGTTVSCGSGVFCYNGGSCNGTFNCNCTTGYQGYDCSRQSCEGRCMNNGTCSDGYCSCTYGYTGTWCETALEVCGTTPNRTICYNNGSCVNGSCVCTDGYTGGNCTDYVCDPPCENEANCGFDNACFCVEGFTGSRCEEDPGPDCGDSYCYNNGSCGANDTCTCLGSYMPPYCRLRGCNSSCLNNGSCYDGSCSCAAGYTGQYCETPYNPGSNMTTSPPTNTTVTPSNGTTVSCGSGLLCYNGGSCNGTSNCNCTTGYQGYDCSRQSCEGRCMNNGTCSDGYCSCAYGYTGMWCETALEVCGTAPNRTICYNNGSCVNGSCVCTDGYTGGSCTDYVCDPPCENDANCGFDNACFCVEGFTGSRCEEAPGPECGDSYCYNNGSCGANDTCTCIGSYMPPYCRLRRCDQPCQNNASCYDGSCSCSFGYSGVYCETTLTVCGNFSEIFCYNNGTCQNNTCVCVGSYTGSDCSTVVGNSTTSSPNSTVAPSNGTTVSCGSGVFCYNGGSCNGTFNCNCTTGYQGYDCSRQSCEGRCMNNGTCSDGYCSCAFGYTGTWCETALEVCGTAPNRTICYNNGSCVGDSCVCTDGFTGGNCTDYICDPLCENEAYCGFDNACFCVEGFTGSRCEEAPGPDCGDSYCYNNGSCGANDTCTCIGSYMPPYCRQRGCNSSCLNNGSCYDGSCSCAAGYTGQYCETPYNPGSNMTTSPPTNTTVTPSNGTSVYCSSDLSCYNGGSCNGTFNCNCTTGYQGRNCSIVTCGGLCRNGGSCSAGICVCQPGYRGQYCQEDVVSACPGGCGGYGQCVNETCVCEPQSTGYNCQERLCDPPCQNGSCGNGQCSCYNGFSGDLCEIAPGPPCDGGYCWNNGICSSDGQCVCTSSFTGRYCRTEMCPFDCLNNGSCSDRRCLCPNGFNGTRCEIPPGPVCGSTYCWNNGTCSSDDVCQCRDPYVGADCTDRSCGFECLNNGSCGYGRCNCQFGFTGERCETEGTRCSDNYLCYNGTCDDESNCVCLPGFRNNECSERDCDAPCMNGYCASGQCFCNRGFGGEQCTTVETPSCGGGLCYNGTCMNDTCVCRPGYRGRECYQRDCVPECENGGGCYDGNCTCRAPYTGDRCEQERELCGDDTVCVGGDCDEDRCVCTGQYYGTSCDRSCRCRNNGTCDMTGNCTCLGRFTGRFCEVELLECGGLCRNGGSCSAGRCVCQPGYSGQYCQEDVASACPGGCGGYGQCVNETCVCEPRFTGYNCQERLCDPPCQNGSCGNGECSCTYGFSGEICEIPPGPPCDGGHCWNNGICSSDGQCVCISSFTGRYCRTEMCPFDCLNNGSCGDQRCQCPYGFNGTRCEIPPGPVCGSTYCWNNGTCSSDDVCLCRDPYVGADCTDRRCESECRNNGSCSFGRCSCQFGFTGEQCETEVTSCSENTLCYNGNCNDENRTCMCLPGFKGVDCSEIECDAPCVNGYCNSGQCICNRGFGGEQCTTVETPRCDGGLCFNGTCMNDTCVCRPGYRGRECYQRDCVPECQNGGGCYNGNCTCRAPYTGDRCEQERELCGDDTVCVGGDCDEDRCVCTGQYYGTSCDRSCRCRNSGTCDVLGNCTCPRRFTGRFCEIELLCTGVACLNGGSCNTSTGACICTEDYTGPNCASAVPVGCDNLVCANGGTAFCVEGRRSCRCPEKYTGTRCETFRFPPCLSDAEMIRSDRYNVTLSFPWPATSYGILYTLSCPCAANPSLTRGIFATRSCGEQGRWRETDYSVCLSATFVRFCVGSAEISTDAINDILSTGRQNLTGGDVALVTESIGSLASTLNLTDPNARDMLLGVLENVLSLDSEVLANTSRSTQASTTIVESFESIGDGIVLPSTGRFSRSGPAYSLTVAAVPPGGPPEEGFGVKFDNGGSESCLLPPSIVPAGTRITASVIRIVALFRGSDPTSVVASNIVSVVVQGRVLTGLAVKIIFNLPKTSETPEGMVDMCQFWNVSANGGIGDWSTDGCEMMGTVGLTVRCACDHLTSFAVVQVPQSTPDPSTPAAANNVAAIVVPILVVLLVLIAGAAIIAGVVVFFIRQRGSKGYDVAGDNTVMENTEVSTPLSSPEGDKNDQDSQSEPKEPKYVTDEDMKAMEANTATSNF